MRFFAKRQSGRHEPSAEAIRRSREGSGPAIVDVETLERLRRGHAPAHLLRSAERAITTNPR